MAQSPVEFCNDVLDEIGTHTIQSFEDNTKNAKVCRRQYPLALEELLSEADWKDFRVRAVLIQTTNGRGAGWYAYALPANHAKTVKVMVDRSAIAGGVFLSADYEPDVPYEIEGDVYYSRVDGLMMEYVRSDPPIASWPAPFRKAMRAGVASKVCYPINRDKAERTSRLSEYELFRDRAKAWEMNRPGETYGHHLPDVMANEFMDGDLFF
jgi:hypothetical protein